MNKATPTVKTCLDKAVSALSEAAGLTFNHPALEARLLLQHASSKSHAWIIAHNDEVLPNKVLSHFNDLVAQRLSGQPIAYIIGYQEFWSLRLKVAACTLIPRQDTEVLIEHALGLDLPKFSRVLDLGTGTGAIALALAKERRNWQVMGLDLIEQAVELAKQNAKINQLKVVFEQSNWFSALQEGQDTFDLICSNPPYIEEQSAYLSQGDLRFEPSTALTSGVDGLDDIKLIASSSSRFLKNSGYLVLEHGFEQAHQVQEILRTLGYVNVITVDDYNKQPRVTSGQWLENG